MTELSPGAERAAKRISKNLKTSRDEYHLALFALIPFVEKAARMGDADARRLLEDVERARVRMVSENMAAGDMLGLG